MSLSLIEAILFHFKKKLLHSSYEDKKNNTIIPHIHFVHRNGCKKLNFMNPKNSLLSPKPT
jgi:hypothetical protein